MTKFRFGLVGAGRVGLAITRHAMERGFDFVWGVDNRLDRLAGLEEAILHRIHPGLADIPELPIDVCIIAVGDAMIATVASELALRGILKAGTLVFHTSGVHAAVELRSLQERGMITGSMHPIQSFADTGGHTPLVGIGCGVEGSDEFCDRAAALAAAFGWHALRIESQNKALYHAACVFAGNFPTVLAAQAAALLRASTIDSTTNPLPYLLPMMEATIRRLHTMPPEASLTGPAARAQNSIVRTQYGHILAHDSVSADVYRSMSLAAATLAGLSTSELSRLRDALEHSEGE
jgi:predicted short-subunit dehydrogenase-like oxidoreductase (DUF2520 family)